MNKQENNKLNDIESEYMLIKDVKEKYTFSEYVNLYSSINPEKGASNG